MYLVAGLGITGQSVCRYFERSEESCLGFDTRENLDLALLSESFPNIPFATGEFPKAWRSKITEVVLSPGIAKSTPWVKEFIQQGIPVIGDIELFARAAGQPIVAITGSNGKSTVTTLVGQVLEAAGHCPGVGGNIGMPALDLLGNDQPEYLSYVLELSSFQLETTYSLQSKSAAVLNISEDHMDRYQTIEDYIQAKLTILNNAELAVVCADKEDVPGAQKTLRFGLSSADCQVSTKSGESWLTCLDEWIMPIDEMALKGPHHCLNALATLALCQPFLISTDVFKTVFSRFRGLPHRTQLIVEKNGIQWINDSKGTNVGATVTAIETLGKSAKSPGKVILLAGGVGKDANFGDLTQPIKEYVRHTILFGRDAQQIANCLPEDSYTLVEGLQEAIENALLVAEPKDIVLFSPACASFDQFDNYVDRGEKFQAWVKSAI